MQFTPKQIKYLNGLFNLQKNGFVYIIICYTNTEYCDIYIGETTHLISRMKTHKRNFNKEYIFCELGYLEITKKQERKKIETTFINKPKYNLKKILIEYSKNKTLQEINKKFFKKTNTNAIFSFSKTNEIRDILNKAKVRKYIQPTTQKKIKKMIKKMNNENKEEEKKEEILSIEELSNIKKEWGKIIMQYAFHLHSFNNTFWKKFNSILTNLNSHYEKKYATQFENEILSQIKTLPLTTKKYWKTI